MMILHFYFVSTFVLATAVGMKMCVKYAFTCDCLKKAMIGSFKKQKIFLQSK